MPPPHPGDIVPAMPDAVSPWLVAGALAAAFLLLLLVETLRPLRRRREPRLRRLGRNLAVAGIAAATMELLQIPILLPVSRWAAAHDFGLLRQLPLPGTLRIVAAIVLLDYTLWFWHLANHRVPFLWRFHSVHHVDRDMDVSTGIRFHFGELGLSVFFRAAQVALIGADHPAVVLWQSLLFVSVLFHHSNTRLPAGLERVLVRVVVTPRMHGIHHSNYRNETDSNWSSLLSAWDYLHRTALLHVPQDEVTIGVPAYGRSEQVTLGKILALPFVRRRDDWRREDGRPPIRPHPESGRARLVP
jgi:sterol desaturase/sphingolipid hydroxylase (fatty acid hydroxylase superfamily)